MKHVNREPLAESVQYSLELKQLEANRKHAEGILLVKDEWKTARQTRPLTTVLVTLKNMMGVVFLGDRSEHSSIQCIT